MKAGWITESLDDTCEMYQPKTISGKDMVEDGAYPVYGANGVIGRYNQFNHEESQLLITCRGATCGTVNVSAPRSWITGNAMVVRPKNGSLDGRYLEYLFRGGIDISKAITGAAQPQITRTNLAPLEISYPNSIAEQQRIVAILDEAFDGIATARANTEKNLQNARALFESHLQSVFSQSGEGWIEKRIEEWCDSIMDCVNKTAPVIDEPTPYKMIRTTNVRNGLVDVSKVRFVTEETYKIWTRRQIPQKGDVILTREAPMGEVGMLLTDDKVFLGQRMVSYRANPEKLDNEFLLFALQSGSLQDQIHAKASGSTVQHMRVPDTKNLLLSVPPLTKQRLVVKQLRSLLDETQRLESLYQRKLDALAELKKSLLHKAFNGEL